MRRHAVVRGDSLTYFDETGELISVLLASEDWEIWLAYHDKFRYDDELGGFIARTETRGFWYYRQMTRDGGQKIIKSRNPLSASSLELLNHLEWRYWYAFRRTSVGVIKAYLGADFGAPRAKTHPTPQRLRQVSLRIAEKEQVRIQQKTNQAQ